MTFITQPQYDDASERSGWLTSILRQIQAEDYKYHVLDLGIRTYIRLAI